MAETSPMEMSHDLAHYLRPMRRHAKLLAACVILGGVLGGGVAALHHPTYTAAAKVLDQQVITDGNPVNGRTTGGDINMDTEAQVVRSLPVATLAAQRLHSTSPAMLLSHVSVSVPTNTTILKISYAAHSTATAIAGANAFANAYLQHRGDSAKAYQSQQVASLSGQLDGLNRELTRLQGRFRSAPPHSATRHQLFPLINSISTRSRAVSDSLGQVQSAQVNPGFIQSPAVIGGSSPNQARLILLLAGLVLGLLAGLVLTALRERFDNSVRSGDDFAREGIELLGDVTSRGRRSVQSGREGDRMTQIRAIQRVAASVGAALGERGGSVFLAELSPASRGDGVDELLAAELSRFGSTTEIVPLIAPPPEHRYQESSVVAEITAGPVVETSPPTVPVSDHRGNGEMLGWPSPAGADPTPASAPELPPRPEPVKDVAIRESEPEPPAPPIDDMTDLVQRVQRALSRARYVILSGAGGSQDSDAYVLASLSQVTVIVAESGVTTRAELADVVEQVEMTSSRIIGGVLWRPRAKRRGAAERAQAGKNGGPKHATAATVLPTASRGSSRAH
jgi:capsular polysaccharide biosynthesis protein